MTDNIATIIGTAGITGLAVGGLLKFFLEKSIEKTIFYQYDRLLENHKTENNLFLEVKKTENLLIAKRYDVAMKACEELHTLVAEIGVDLLDLKEDPDFFDKLINKYHPNYKKRFHIILAKFGASNDMFSSYSLEFDILVQADTIRSIVDLFQNKKSSNIYWIYRRIWLTVVTCLSTLIRVCSDAKFWEPNNNYGHRSDSWAIYDRRRTLAFLKSCVINHGTQDSTTFRLSLEEADGTKRFWTEFPPAGEAADTSSST